LRLEEARAEARVPRPIPHDDNFYRERARIATNIRKNYADYGLPSRPSNDAVEQALLASPEYEELISRRNELRGTIPDPIDIRATKLVLTQRSGKGKLERVNLTRKGKDHAKEATNIYEGI
jgi:hypothetical protein